MRIAMVRDGPSSAAVTLVIHGDPEVRLDGIIASEPRTGFLALSLPPLEAWAERLTSLPRAARERIADGAFYQRLLDVIRERWPPE